MAVTASSGEQAIAAVRKAMRAPHRGSSACPESIPWVNVLGARPPACRRLHPRKMTLVTQQLDSLVIITPEAHCVRAMGQDECEMKLKRTAPSRGDHRGTGTAEQLGRNRPASAFQAGSPSATSTASATSVTSATSGASRPGFCRASAGRAALACDAAAPRDHAPALRGQCCWCGVGSRGRGGRGIRQDRHNRCGPWPRHAGRGSF